MTSNKPSKLEILSTMGKDAANAISWPFRAKPAKAVGRAAKEIGRGYIAEQLVTTFNKKGYDIAKRHPYNSNAWAFGVSAGVVQDMFSVGMGIFYLAGYGFTNSFEKEALAYIAGAKVLTNLGSLAYQWYESAKKRTPVEGTK